MTSARITYCETQLSIKILYLPKTNFWLRPCRERNSVSCTVAEWSVQLTFCSSQYESETSFVSTYNDRSYAVFSATHANSGNVHHNKHDIYDINNVGRDMKR